MKKKKDGEVRGRRASTRRKKTGMVDKRETLKTKRDLKKKASGIERKKGRTGRIKR